MDVKGVVGVSAIGLLGLEPSLHCGCFFRGLVRLVVSG